MNDSSTHSDAHSAPARGLWWTAVEIIAIVGVLVIVGGSPTPNVNEAHYLAKAKHYWDPLWLEGDVFLESEDAHAVFYWTFGWLTLLFPLPIVAWIGRFITWLLLAWAWQRLSWRLIPIPWMSLLTATLFALGVEHLHMAGEWIIGGVEAKGFSYVCVLFAIHALANNRWNRAWILLGGAAAFHVLVGGWAIAATGFAWLAAGKDRPSLVSMLPALIASFCLSLASLAPALLLSRGDATATADANAVYVWYRLAHHLVFHEFDYWFIARHALLIVAVAIGANWYRQCGEWKPAQRTLAGFTAGCVLLAITGAVIDQALLYDRDTANALLRFYWFRLSDVITPAAAALLTAMIAARFLSLRPSVGKGIIVAMSLLAAVGLASIYWAHRADPRPLADAQTLPTFESDPQRTLEIYYDWRSMCQWVRENTPEDAQFITPRRQQTFKWYAERKEVVSWKDVPQDTAGIVDWWDRFTDVHAYNVKVGGLAARSDLQLIELTAKYDADYVIIDRIAARRPIGLKKVYPLWPDSNESYEVYRIGPRPSDD